MGQCLQLSRGSLLSGGGYYQKFRVAVLFFSKNLWKMSNKVLFSTLQTSTYLSFSYK